MPILIPPFRFVLPCGSMATQFLIHQIQKLAETVSISGTSTWCRWHLLCLWYMADLFSGSEFSVSVASGWLPFSAAPLSYKCVASIGSIISLHFSFNHVVMFVCCFAFPRRLFSLFVSDFSQFTVLMGISAPATLQHVFFLKCFFSFCVLYKAGFTFDSYFLLAKIGNLGILLKLFLHNRFSSSFCLLWVAPILGIAELPDELLCCVSALLWVVFRRPALHSWDISELIGEVKM